MDLAWRGRAAMSGLYGGRGRTDISMLPELGDYLLPMSGL